MNKIIQINLGGYPFTIDEDAYEHLKSYLNIIHRHFRKSPGYEDITSDIESRVAELFQERLEGRPIINLQDVKKVIIVMGTPEEFGADPIEEAGPGSAKYRTGKRLFRDPENQVIGGISAGIAAYFGFSNPLWIRLAFIGLTLMGGLGIATYIILWFALPQAESASDKLAMRGEPINISTIGKVVETELDHLSDAVSELGEEIVAKKKSSSRADNLLKSGFSAVWKFCKKTITVMLNIFKPLLLIISIALIIFFSLAWIGTLIGVFYTAPFLEYLLPIDLGNSVLPQVNLLFVVGIPLLALILLVSRLMFQTRIPVYWQVALAVLLVSNFGSLAFFGINTAQDFAIEGELTDTFEIPATEVLKLDFQPDPYASGFYLPGGTLQLDGKTLISKEVGVEISVATGPEIKLIKNFAARGSNLGKAEALARQIEDIASFNDDVLHLRQYFKIAPGNKWRNQYASYYLKLPVGQYFTYSGATRHWGMHPHWRVDDHHGHFDREHQGKMFKMTEEGIICIDCENDEAREYELFRENFMTLEIDGKMDVQVLKATEYGITLITDPRSAKSIDISQETNQLKISRSESNGQAVRLIIRTPELEFLALRNLQEATVRGFDNGIFRLRAENTGKIHTDLDSDTVSLTLSDVTKLSMRGKIGVLNGQLRNQSKIEADNARIERVAIDLQEDSHAHFGRLRTLRRNVDQESSLRFWHVDRIVED